MDSILRVAHHIACRFVILPAHRARRWSNPSTRAAYAAYRDGLVSRERMHESPSRTQSEAQLAALREAVRFAAELPFWQQRLREAGLDWMTDFSRDDFARVPPLERQDITTAGDALLHPSVSASQRRKMATGGSSGRPTTTWTGPLERGWRESGAEFFERRMGMRPGARTAYLWGHHLDPVTRASMRERVEDLAFNRRWFDCFRLSPDVLDAYHEALQRYSPDVMVAYGSALASLAEHLAATGVTKPAYPRIGFITGAEKLYPHQRKQIETVFGRPVHERYGGRDIGLIGFQSAPATSAAFAVDWMNVYPEIEEDTTTGSLLVTKLHADAMPLLRYRSGDLIRVPHDEPTRGFTRIEEVLGRELQRVWLRDGRWMHGTVVPHLLKDFPVSDYQLHQREDFSVVLRLVPTVHFSDHHARELRSALAGNLPGLEITIRHVEDIGRSPAGKWFPVVSDVQANAVRGAAK